MRMWNGQDWPWPDGTVDQRFYPEASVFSGGAVKEGLCAG